MRLSFSMGESAALTLCTIAETGAGLKYICLNMSLKITWGEKKAHETHRLIDRRGGNDLLFFFRDPTIPARSWPGLRSVSALIGYE